MKPLYAVPVVMISILAVIAVSGCIIPGFPDLPGFSSDMVQITRTAQNVGPTYPMVIDNSFTLPENTVIPGNELRLFIYFSDKESDPLKTAENVVLDLYDTFLFKDQDGISCTTTNAKCEPDVCSKNSPCRMSPQEQKVTKFVLRAPNQSEIANVITPSELGFKITYDYSGSTGFDVLAITEAEILRRQQAGEPLSVTLDERRSSGPVKVYITAGEKYFIQNQQVAYMVFKVKDEGNGMVKDSRISSGNLVIDFPVALAKNVGPPQQTTTTPTAQVVNKPFLLSITGDATDSEKCSEDFNCVVVGDQWECKNKNCLELFKGESAPLRFEMTGIANNLGTDQPHLTYLIKSSIIYTYEIRGKTQIEINPNTAMA